jgi:hypothetical protein
MFEPLAGTTRCAWLRAGDPHAMNTNEIDSHLVYPGELGRVKSARGASSAAGHRSGMRPHTLAWCAISHAPVHSSSAAKRNGQFDAGAASVSSLCAARLHAGERFAIRTGNLPARASAASTGAPPTWPDRPFACPGGSHLFCELSFRQRSCRRAHHPPHRC